MTATRMLGVDSWFSYDACPLAADVNIDGWLLEYAGGAVVVPVPTFDEEQIVEAVLVDDEDDSPMPDQVDTTINPWDRVIHVYDENTAGQPVETKLAEFDRAEAAFRALRGDELPTNEYLTLEDPASLGSRPARRRRRETREARA